MAGQLVTLDDPEALAQEAADRFVALADRAIKERGRFAVALSGGSTPRRLHALLAAAPRKTQVDWTRVHVFFGDERFLPADHEDGNYRMATDTLLAEVAIPDENVTPFITEGIDPEEAAAIYERALLDFAVSGRALLDFAVSGRAPLDFAVSGRAPLELADGDVPRLDLVLLGLGEDAHTASLFPGQPEVAAPSSRLVVAVHDAPKPPPVRLTLTYRAINAARTVLFLVAGKSKAEALRSVRASERTRVELPALGVAPEPGELVWLVDRAAASELG